MHTFSICIPTKNRASTHLPELLKSIEGQNLPNGWKTEIIICDDGSDVLEIKLLYELINRSAHDITLIEHKDSKGVAASRNSAVNLSTGELITDLDDDDILLQNSIFNRISAHSKNIKWSFGNAIKVDKNLRYKINKDLVPEWDINDTSKTNVINGLLSQKIFYWASTRTYNRDALYKDGKLIEWDPNFIVAQDLEHWVRIVEKNGPPYHINQYLVAWREKRHSWGINGMRSGLQKEMIEKIKIKHKTYL
jgi:glycosyltransferase involved in cell wall biosynthesis